MLSIEAIGIETARRPPDPHKPDRNLRLLLGLSSWMPKKPLVFIGHLNSGDDFHVLGMVYRTGFIEKYATNTRSVNKVYTERELFTNVRSSF